jgi:hypothetical protein
MTFCGTQFVIEISELRNSSERPGGNMKKKYQFADLSKDEKEYLEMILLEEIDIQSWYAITYSTIFGEEQILTVQ